MLNSNHPDDERLSALASHDPDATADASLTAHVSTCDRCTDLVEELGALRASLADLPDLRPARPLRLLPAVAEEPARVDRLGGWARRFFAPILATGAAVAMVGLIGTAAPALDQMASGPGAQSREAAEESGAAAFDATAEDGTEAAPGAAGAEPTTSELDDASAEGEAQPDTFLEASAAAEASGEAQQRTMAEADEDRDRDVAVEELPAERSPWPMVLFTGVAVMVAAALLRWILAPRAG